MRVCLHAQRGVAVSREKTLAVANYASWHERLEMTGAAPSHVQSPILHVALYRPEIHPNAGNIARLCAANGIPLHLIGDLGFRTDERSVRRAGLDYWPHVDLRREIDFDELRASLPGSRCFFFSARAERAFTDVEYLRGDCLVFGPESRGLPEQLLEMNRAHTVRIPMRTAHVRSLNLASAVAIAVYEALRQFEVRTG